MPNPVKKTKAIKRNRGPCEMKKLCVSMPVRIHSGPVIINARCLLLEAPAAAKAAVDQPKDMAAVTYPAKEGGTACNFWASRGKNTPNGV